MTAVRHEDGICRCHWCGTDPVYVAYHDTEWGVPLHTTNGWYERIVLETMQAGLSWITVLRKRDHYRAVCHQIDPHIVATYGEDDITRLMADPGYIDGVLRDGAARARALAAPVLAEVHKAVGLLTD
jgi:DNA-3-methyladenine glycosylase I